MRILHTSDWHLGRQFHGQSLQEDHDVILEQVFQAIAAYQPDVLIIAGDIYDRPAPPAFAVRQFNAFIQQVYSQTNSAIVWIAGNHDSGDRIGANSALVDTSRVLIRGPLSADNVPLVLHDEHGPVAFSALPFGNEYAARACFDDETIASPAQVMAAQLSDAQVHVPAGTRWVVTAHVFVANAKASDSERPIAVGGIETVPANLFAAVDYVALGHLHKPQSLADGKIRYSGSPLAFGFDEGEASKSMSLVDMDAEGKVEIQELPFKPLRGVCTVMGALADLVSPGSEEISQDFVKVVLTDEGALIDPMGQVREVYPNAMALSYARDPKDSKGLDVTAAQGKLNDPEVMISDFLEFIRDDSPDAETTELMQKTLVALQGQETAQ